MNTSYFLDLVAGNVFGTKKTPAIPAKYYLGLSTTAPTIAGGGVSEPVGGSYNRVELNSLTAPDGGNITNATSVSFAESTSDWGTITHYVVYDAITDGNLLIYGQLSASRRVEPATVMTIKAGSLNLSVINPQ